MRNKKQTCNNTNWLNKVGVFLMAVAVVPVVVPVVVAHIIARNECVSINYTERS